VPLDPFLERTREAGPSRSALGVLAHRRTTTGRDVMDHRVWNQRPGAGPLLLLGLALVASGIPCPGCADRRVEREARLTAQVDSLRAVIRSRSGLREDVGQSAGAAVVNGFQIKELRRRGLSDPLVDLAKDLRGHPEVLPESLVGEVGGTYGFYNPEGIHLLTTKWVLAEFDDGHRLGHMLLEFAIRDSAKIDWKPIAWALDD